MKKKIFFAALVLFIVFLNSLILIVSIIILRDKLSVVRDKCLAEHYVIASSLLGDMQALEQRGNHVEENIDTLSMDSLNTGTPTDTDLTMEEAAEAGRQYLGNLFGLDLEGAYVYMSYNPGTETFPRAFWSGDVLFQKEQKPESTRWTYMIDAVTGELFNIGYGRQLDVNVPLGYDKALEKDYSVYAELAQKKAEEYKLIDSPIDRVEYNCQGYAGNDPTIAVDVIGKNGEIVNMDFSRYDQTFLGLITDTSRRVTESAFDSAVGEVESAEAEKVGENTVTWTTSIVK